MTDVDKIFKLFKKEFNGNPIIVRSPGRVNLLGEHTDYNDGFVLPAAIDKNIIFAIAPRKDSMCFILSADMNEKVEFNLNELDKSKLNWPNYLLGVIDQLSKANIKIGGFECAFGGDIPIGSGLSSSAALEAGFAFVLNEIFDLGLDKLNLVKTAQKAENNFVGVRCGIMDQFVNIFGQKDKVLKIDCRSLEFKYFPLSTSQTKIILCDTKVKHSLASTEYNNRRKQCEDGVKILKHFDDKINSLRDVGPDFLKDHKEDLEEVIYKRCEYVVKENQRVNLACEDLEENDFDAFGKKMFQTHIGLKDEYEVSCKELDALVDIASDSNGVFGSRMMGGGFGGCTINLVDETGVDNFSEKVKRKYKSVFGYEPEIYQTEIVSGTEKVI